MKIKRIDIIGCLHITGEIYGCQLCDMSPKYCEEKDRKWLTRDMINPNVPVPAQGSQGTKCTGNEGM